MVNSEEAQGEHPSKEQREASFVNKLGHFLQNILNKPKALGERNPIFKVFYRGLVISVGFLVILAGIAMLVLPGPGWLTIFLGLAILGTEFVWPRKILGWLRTKLEIFKERYLLYKEARKKAK